MREMGGVCMFCGGEDADKVCRTCDEGYHIACARERGQFQMRERGHGFVSTNVVNYDWECPNCGCSVSGQM